MRNTTANAISNTNTTTNVKLAAGLPCMADNSQAEMFHYGIPFGLNICPNWIGIGLGYMSKFVLELDLDWVNVQIGLNICPFGLDICPNLIGTGFGLGISYLDWNWIWIGYMSK